MQFQNLMHLLIKPTIMSKIIQVKVPQPCHENWNKMSETDKGRFCNSCNKEVIDFSLMSDEQILNHISKASNGGICGRFASPQLNRDMVIKKQRKFMWLKYFMHVIIPALLISNKSNAQQKIIGDTILCSPPKILNEIACRVGGIQIMGKVKPQPVIINGRVTDEKGNAVPFGSIMIKGTSKGVSCDKDGIFSLAIPENIKTAKLTASSIGYETNETHIDIKGKTSDEINISIILKESSSMGLGEVVVVGYASYRKPKKKVLQPITDTIKNVINKLMTDDAVKVYPNPIHAGASFNVDFNVGDIGEYAINIVTISGQLIMQKKIQINSKQHIEQITCGNSMMSGIYFVQVINESNKKVYANKILIQ